MKRKIIPIVISILSSLTLTDNVLAAEIKVSGDLELYYENSSDIKSQNYVDGDTQDDDQFKTQQLYLTIDGKFESNMTARLKLDGADIVSSDGKTVTEKIVEEANFTLKNIGGSPVTLVFGKDEMPFGLDYDKHLTDPLQHNFEIDKVWGVHVITNLNDQHKIAVALYENRNSTKKDENELTSNYTARYNASIAENLDIELSFGQEQYETEISGLDDEKRYNAGLVYKFKSSSVYFEYTAFQSRNGSNRDPSLVSLGLEHKMDKHNVWGRIEIVDADEAAGEKVEENFYTIGYAYNAEKSYTLSAEFANFSTADYKDASDLNVADGSIENSIKLGVRAKF